MEILPIIGCGSTTQRIIRSVSKDEKIPFPFSEIIVQCLECEQRAARLGDFR